MIATTSNNFDSEHIFIVYNDRPQAGIVRKDEELSEQNHIQLLIDRRLVTHDKFGIDEPPPLSKDLTLEFKIAIDKI